MQPAIAARIAARGARHRSRLRRHELDARGCAGRRGRLDPASRTSRRASGAATSRCRRSTTGSRSTGSRGSSSAPTTARKRTLQDEGVLGRHLRRRRRDGGREPALRPRRARARSRFRTSRVRTSSRRSTARRTSSSRDSAAIVDGLNRIDEMVVFPVHPRTRARMQEEGLALGEHVRLIEPLSYLELASLASQARVIVTDSGGLQKEAYWYGVPCVTVRPSTEWVDTVAVGANVLVDDDPAGARAGGRIRVDAREPARALRRRPRLGADRAGARRYDPEPMKRDVAIVGAGLRRPASRTHLRRRRQERAARRRGRRTAWHSSTRARATSRTSPLRC